MDGSPRSRRLPGRALPAALAAALALSAVPARADEPRAPEADTNPNTRPQAPVQVNLILVGAAVTVGWYGAALGTSYLWSDSDGAPDLRIPVAGPFMALAKTGCGVTEGPDCDTLGVVVRTLFTALSAVGQTGGLLVIGEGLFLPTASRARRAAPESPPGLFKLRRPDVAITPITMGRAGYGLGLEGAF